MHTASIGEKRNPGIVILLIIITLGIYEIVWYYKINREIKEHDPSQDFSPGLAVFALFIPIVNLFSLYNTAARLKSMQLDDPNGGINNPFPTFLWLFTGIGYFIVVQNALNRHWERHELGLTKPVVSLIPTAANVQLEQVTKTAPPEQVVPSIQVSQAQKFDLPTIQATAAPKTNTFILYCAGCGKAIDPGSKFCIYCGRPAQINNETPIITAPTMARKKFNILYLVLPLTAILLISGAILGLKAYSQHKAEKSIEQGEQFSNGPGSTGKKQPLGRLRHEALPTTNAAFSKTDEKIEVRTKSGGTLEINNIYKRKLSMDDYGVDFSNNPKLYNVRFWAKSHSFDIDVKDPVDKAIRAAEDDFPLLLGISKEDACSLDVHIGSCRASSIEDGLWGARYGLSYCPNVEHIPTKYLLGNYENVPTANANLSNSTQQSLNWMNYPAGMETAKDKKKPVVIVFYAIWCKYCKQLNETTLRNPEIINILNNKFIAIQVNVESTNPIFYNNSWTTERELADQYKVTGYPTIWFIDENGKKIAPLPGYTPPEDFKKVLTYITSGAYANGTKYEDYLHSNR